MGTDEYLGDFSPEELTQYLQATAEWIGDYFDKIEEQNVFPQIKPGAFTRQLPSKAPAKPEDMEHILADFAKLVPPAITHWNHPNFHAWFANTGSVPGIVAETLAAALNNNAMVWRSGPASTEMETVVCDWLRQILGLPAGLFGMIHDTASVAIIAALAAGRHRATEGEVRTRGLRQLPPLRVYASEEAHSSVERAAIVLGLGTENVVKVTADREFRMIPEELGKAIAKDKKAGHRPMAVVATVGTTGTTSIDPVAKIAPLCKEHALWLHVDAAYGGAMAAVPEYRWVLEGCEHADSLVVNPHKWLFVPMDCSVLYCKSAEDFRRAFSLVPSYLETPEDEIARNLTDYGPAMGRRFRSLKLWMVMRAYGSEGIAARVKYHLDLAQELQQWIARADNWEQLAPAPMSTVLFRHHPAGISDEAQLERHNRAILEEVNRSGQAFLSHTIVRGAFGLRLAIGNLRTQRSHLLGTWRLLQDVASRTD
jgi:aromatic-L-amino-acid decarboxylase